MRTLHFHSLKVCDICDNPIQSEAFEREDGKQGHKACLILDRTPTLDEAIKLMDKEAKECREKIDLIKFTRQDGKEVKGYFKYWNENFVDNLKEQDRFGYNDALCIELIHTHPIGSTLKSILAMTLGSSHDKIQDQRKEIEKLEAIIKELGG